MLTAILKLLGVGKWIKKAAGDVFALMAAAMYQAASELGIRIRWGANWDGDSQWREKGESDNPHFELA